MTSTPLDWGAVRHQFRHVLHQFAQVEIRLLQLQLAGLDLGEIEDVVDDLQQGIAGAADRVRKATLAVSELRLQQQLRHAQHAVHRGPDLMAHVGQELGLQLRRHFG